MYALVSMGHARYLFFKLKNNKKVYVYDDFSGKGLNCILYVEDINDCPKLLNYYSLRKKGVNGTLPFRLRYLSVERPVYIINYIGRDSSIIEFIDIATCCWGYVHGFVDKSTSHLSAPSKERLKLYHEYLEQLPPSPKYYRRISDYGLYCECK